MTSSESGGIAVPADTPQTADTDAPPPSSGAPVTKRAHRFLVPVLLVLATIIGIPAAFAVWVNRQALNTSNWSSTSGKVLEDKQVQTALSAYLVHELFTNVERLRGSAEGAAQAVAAAGRPGRRRVAAARRLGRPEAAGQPAGAGGVGSGQRRRAQGAFEGAERGRAGRLDQVRGRDPELAHARQPARGHAGRLEPGRRGAVEAAGLDRGVGPGGGAEEARDHAAAGQRPAGDHALKSAQDRPGHRQRRQEPGDRAAGDRDPAVRARRVPRTRTAPADVANDRLVLRPDRSGAAADPQNRRQRGRQRPGQGSVEQAGRARRVEHRHVAAVQHRGRDDRVRDRDRGGRLARRPNPPGHRDPKGHGPVVAREPRGRLLRGRRRAAARGALGSDTGVPEYLVDPGVRRPARARRHDAPTRDRRSSSPDIEHDQALRLEPRAQPGRQARSPPPAAETQIGEPARSELAPDPSLGASRHSSDSPRSETAARSPTTSTRPRRRT